MESCVSRHGVNPQGSFWFAPAAAGMSGWMCIGGSSKITRTAEDAARPNLPVWFRLRRIRIERRLKAGNAPIIAAVGKAGDAASQFVAKRGCGDRPPVQSSCG